MFNLPLILDQIIVNDNKAEDKKSTSIPNVSDEGTRSGLEGQEGKIFCHVNLPNHLANPHEKLRLEIVES